MRPVDLSGRRFGRLMVVARAPDVGKRRRWECLCDCGETKTVNYVGLKTGDVTSCGCLRLERLRAVCVKHGQASAKGKSREYRIWRGMRQRCLNPLATNYARYGGLGVVVCNRWASFEAFFADMGECPANFSLDRINPRGNYDPGNCRWADAKTQANNKRKVAA